MCGMKTVHLFAVDSQIVDHHQSGLLPFKEASTGGCILQKSEDLCLLQGLHYHTRGLPETLCNTTQGKASSSDGCVGRFSMGSGTA